MKRADPVSRAPSNPGRRTFMAMISGGLLAAPLAAGAQPAGKIYRVGLIAFGTTLSEMAGPEPVNPSVRAFGRRRRPWA